MVKKIEEVSKKVGKIKKGSLYTTRITTSNPTNPVNSNPANSNTANSNTTNSNTTNSNTANPNPVNSKPAHPNPTNSVNSNPVNSNPVNSKPPTNANPTNAKHSYAQAAKNGQKTQKMIGEPGKTIRKEEKDSFQKRQLVLLTSIDQDITPFQTRNKINAYFKEKLGTSTPVIAAITKLARKQNIILTTTKGFSSSFLL